MRYGRVSPRVLHPTIVDFQEADADAVERGSDSPPPLFDDDGDCDCEADDVADQPDVADQADQVKASAESSAESFEWVDDAGDKEAREKVGGDFARRELDANVITD